MARLFADARLAPRVHRPFLGLAQVRHDHVQGLCDQVLNPLAVNFMGMNIKKKREGLTR